MGWLCHVAHVTSVARLMRRERACRSGLAACERAPKARRKGRPRLWAGRNVQDRPMAALLDKQSRGRLTARISV